MSKTPPPRTDHRAIVVSHWIDAPRARVYEAFTTADQVDMWWGLADHAMKTLEMTVRPGGRWRYALTGTDGVIMNRITYTNVQVPEALEYEHGPDMEEALPHFLTTITLEEKDGGTVFNMRMLFPTAPARTYAMEKYNAQQSGVESLERLSAYLAGS